jgi:hypothetical protein
MADSAEDQRRAEDQRSAANICASLSSYVMTASLGVIAAQAVLATFVLDKRDHLTWFYVWGILGLVSSVVSVVLGGKGIGGIASSGFHGSWTLHPKHNYFDLQSKLCLIGMGLLICSLFCGTTKLENPKLEQGIQQSNASVQRLQIELDDLRSQYATLSDQVKLASKPAPRCHLARPKKKSN